VCCLSSCSLTDLPIVVCSLLLQAARKARNAKESGEGGDKQAKGAADNAKQWRQEQLGKKLKAKQQQGQKQQQQQQDAAQKW
jgi:hypothetical protein